MVTSWSSDDIAALERAIASGARKVKFRDREVEYRSLDEMREALRLVRGATTGGTKSRRRFAQYEEGIQ
jgi:hypothetical protein